MKKILMINTNEFTTAVRAYKEAVYLISRGFEVTILCWHRDRKIQCPRKEIIDGIRVIRYRIPTIPGTGYRQLGPFFRFIHRCGSYVQRHEYDYLCCHDFDGALVGWLINGGKKAPMITDMHEFYERGGACRRWIWRQATIFLLKQSRFGLYENAAYLEAPYRSVRNRLRPLRNYPDADLIEPRPKTESEVFRIGYHGAVRGQLAEFTALFEAVKGMEDVTVEVNGDGPDNGPVRQLSERYSNVTVKGAFDGTKDLSDMYARTDLLFVGYNPDNPNYQGDAEVVKFYEAIFTGTPMLVTERIGMGDKVKTYGYGLTCDTRDPDAIRKAIRYFIDHPEFCKTCAEHEKANAGRYDWKSAVRVLDEVFAE